MISSAIWKKHEQVVFQRPPNSTSPKYLWPLKNPQVHVFFQISREIVLLLINNVHAKIWAMYLQRTGLQCSIHSSQLWWFKNALVLSLILEKVSTRILLV